MIMEKEDEEIITPGEKGHDISLNLSATETINMACTQLENRIKSIENGFQIYKEAFKSLYFIAEEWTVNAQKIHNNISGILKAFQKIASDYAKIIPRIPIPSLSEKDKQEILESYIQWGKLGWSCFQSAPINFYYDSPGDAKDANAKVKHLCTIQQMENVFNELRHQKMNHEDLESAIFCFYNKQYKACALILFSLIDAKMIRNQRNGWKSVGEGAVRRLKEQYEEKKNDQLFHTVLFCSNLFSCLESLFERAKNFEKEPNIINRNFVNHGMSRKRIRRRDCVQLFLALNNLTSFLSGDIIG